MRIRIDKLKPQRFLRVISGRIAAHVTGARKGNSFGRFWQGLAYSRVLKSRFEELRLQGYFAGNRTEAAQGREARETFLREFNAWVEGLRRGRPPPRKPAWA